MGRKPINLHIRSILVCVFLAYSPDALASGNWKVDSYAEWMLGSGSKIDVYYFPGSIRTLRNVGDEFSFVGGNVDPLQFSWTYAGSDGHFERTVRSGYMTLKADSNDCVWWNTKASAPRIYKAIEGDFTVEASLECKALKLQCTLARKLKLLSALFS